MPESRNGFDGIARSFARGMSPKQDMNKSRINMYLQYKYGDNADLCKILWVCSDVGALYADPGSVQHFLVEACEELRPDMWGEPQYVSMDSPDMPAEWIQRKIAQLSKWLGNEDVPSWFRAGHENLNETVRARMEVAMDYLFQALSSRLSNPEVKSQTS